MRKCHEWLPTIDIASTPTSLMYFRKDAFDINIIMKQKYFLAAAGIVLAMLIIITIIIGNNKKNRKSEKIIISKSQHNADTLSSIPTIAPIYQEEKKGEDVFKNTAELFLGYTDQEAVALSTKNPNAPTYNQTHDRKEPYTALVEMLGFFGQNFGSLQQSSSYSSDKLGGSKSSTDNSNRVYYSQCNGEYDTYPLHGGCTVCKAGCGQTSVAMILSSYVDKKFTPSAVVELYKQNGLESGCKGSTIADAQQILEQNGMKTTDILYYGEMPTEEVINDLRSYIQYGWTMFMLAKFCPKGCGHFFWIVDVDDNNNVWTYDPKYGNIDGKKIVPLNETSLNPPAQYYAAFGVRKMN